MPTLTLIALAVAAATRPPADTKLVTEAVVDAPVAAVWAAFTTKVGQESWNVAHADIDLRVGGLMRTHYDPKGALGDPGTIENTILCFDPGRMFAIQATRPPANFPLKEALKGMWTVVYFEPVGADRTKVTAVGLGFGTDADGQKLRGFFEAGNAYTMKKLQQKFSKPAK